MIEYANLSTLYVLDHDLLSISSSQISIWNLLARSNHSHSLHSEDLLARSNHSHSLHSEDLLARNNHSHSLHSEDLLARSNHSHSLALSSHSTKMKRCHVSPRTRHHKTFVKILTQTLYTYSSCRPQSFATVVPYSGGKSIRVYIASRRESLVFDDTHRENERSIMQNLNTKPLHTILM